MKYNSIENTKHRIAGGNSCEHYVIIFNSTTISAKIRIICGVFIEKCDIVDSKICLVDRKIK